MADYGSDINIELSAQERWQALEARVHLLEKWKESLSQTQQGSEAPGAASYLSAGGSLVREPKPQSADRGPVEADNLQEHEDEALIVREDPPVDENVEEDGSDEFDVCSLDDQTDEVKLQENLWNSAFFVGITRQRGCCGSVWLLSLVILCSCIQGAFLLVTERSFIEPKFGEKQTSELTRWRMNAGHNVKYYDSMTETSLTERVCNQGDIYQVEMSDTKHALIESINKYLQDYDSEESESSSTEKKRSEEALLPTGAVLCIMAVIIWSMTVLTDIMDTIAVSLGLWRIPRGRTEFRKTPEGSLRLQGISRPRLFYCYIVQLNRCCIALLMWEYGCRYLIHYSIEPSDMMVNAVALAIVLDVPKALYMLVPLGTKHLVGRLEPMPPADKKRQFRGLDLGVVLVAIALMVCTICSGVQLGHVIANIKEAKHALCGGETNFVYGLDAFGNFYNSKVEPKKALEEGAAKDASQDSRYLATKTFIDLLMHPQKDEGKKAEDGALGIVFVGEGVSAVAALPLLPATELVEQIQSDTTGCEDKFEDNEHFLKELAKSPEREDATSCAGMKPLCNKLHYPMVRAFCPVTCGCATPGADLLVAVPKAGCAAKCQGSDAYTSALRDLPCVEKSAEALQKDLSWIDMSHQFGDMMKASFKDFPSHWETYCSLDGSLKTPDCAELFRTRGCGLVTVWMEKFDQSPCQGNWFGKADNRVSRFMAELCPRQCGCMNGDPIEKLVARGCPGTCKKAETSETPSSNNDVKAVQ